MQSTSSDPTITDTSIIRTGSDGRLRYSPAQRLELLDAFDQSGQSAMAFSRQIGVHYQTFIAWLRKRRLQASSPAGHSGPAFAEVLVEGLQPSEVPGAALRINLPCGAVIEINSRASLPLAAELLSTLRRPC